MTLLVDIGCPDCGRKRSVRKEALGRYHCAECETTFTLDDVSANPDLLS